MTVKIKNTSDNPLPDYKTALSAGMDLHAFCKEPVIMGPMETKLVKTGLFIELPAGHEAQIRPRSGLALKSGITVLNAPGTIDADYRGEIGVILINLSKTGFTINNGDRIAQMVIAKHETINWELTAELEESDRGSGGFGSTGKQ